MTGIKQSKSVQRLHACTGALYIGVIDHDVSKNFTAIERFKQLPSSCEFIRRPTTVFVLHGQQVIDAVLEALLHEKLGNQLNL